MATGIGKGSTLIMGLLAWLLPSNKACVIMDVIEYPSKVKFMAIS